jgi:hypothetical protein
MTSDRPYRKGTSFSAATEEIVRCSGGQFDPQIVEVFLTLPKDTWSDLREEIGKLSPSARSVSLYHPAVAPSKQAVYDRRREVLLNVESTEHRGD